MSKNKDTIDELRKKFFDKKKELQVENANKSLLDELPEEGFFIAQDPEKKGRNFVIFNFKFDVTTKKIIMDEVRVLVDKTVGLASTMSLNNLKIIFDKNKRRK